MKMKKITLAYALLVIVFLPLGQNLAVAQKPLYGGTLTVGWPRDTISFNGVVDYWMASARADIQIYNKLIMQTPGYGWKGDLAQSWEIAPDGKAVTFNLYRNVTWHDGKKFTSADVKWHYEQILTYKPPTYSFPRFSGVLDKIETPDDYTVVFRLKKWSWGAFEGFGYGNADNFILPKHIYEGTDLKTNPANWKPIGTGPFKMTEYVKDSHFIVEANEAYFKGRPYLDKVIFKIIPSAPTALIALEKKEVQLNMISPPPGEMTRLKTVPNLKLLLLPASTGSCRITFNNRPEGLKAHPWLNDIRVKQAIAYALDTKTLASKILLDQVAEARGPLGAGMTYWLKPAINEVYAYNVAKAEALLDDAGYKKGPDGIRIRVKMPSYGGQPYQDAAEFVRAELRKVGIDVEVILVESGTFMTMYEANPEGMRDYAMVLNNMGAGPDPERNRLNYLTANAPPNGTNFGFYSNKRVDELLNAGSEERSMEKRRELYYEFQDIIMKELPIIGLFSSRMVVTYWDEYAGVENYWEYTYSPISPVWWTKGRPLTTTAATVATRTTTTPIPTTAPSFDPTMVIALVVIVVGIGLFWRLRKTRKT